MAEVGASGRTIRIGAAQYPIDEVKTLGAWRDKVSSWVSTGASHGAQLLVFPEYAAIEQAAALGVDVAADLKATLLGVAQIADDRVAFHQELAAKHNVHILAGSGPVLGTDARVYNGAQLVTPGGQVGVQTKLMMTPFEVTWGVSSGGPVRVFETSLGRIGIAICYDSEFPLIARSMAVSGAEIVLVPSCTERVSGYHRVRAGAMARALENTVVSVQSPTVGDAMWSPAVDTNVGAAGIFVPAEQGLSDTGILASGDFNDPGWVYGDVDLDALTRLREGGEMANHKDWERQPSAGQVEPTPAEVVRLMA